MKYVMSIQFWLSYDKNDNLIDCNVRNTKKSGGLQYIFGVDSIFCVCPNQHYSDVIIGAIASQITSLTNVYQAKIKGNNQSSASLAFVRGIHSWPATVTSNRDLWSHAGVYHVRDIYDAMLTVFIF